MTSPQMTESIAMHFATIRDLQNLQRQVLSNLRAHHARSMRNQDYSREQSSSSRADSVALVVGSTPFLTERFGAVATISWEPIIEDFKHLWALRTPVVFGSRIVATQILPEGNDWVIEMECKEVSKSFFIAMKLVKEIANIKFSSPEVVKGSPFSVEDSIPQQDILLILSHHRANIELPMAETIDKIDPLALNKLENLFRSITLFASKRIVIDLGDEIFALHQIHR